MTDAKVNQKDARILREALAKIANSVPSHHWRAYVIERLKAYADAVTPYCKCSDTSYVHKEAKMACLDCGKRHDMPSVETKKVTGPKVEVMKPRKPKDTRHE